jgi:capsid portal protein
MGFARQQRRKQARKEDNDVTKELRDLQKLPLNEFAQTIYDQMISEHFKIRNIIIEALKETKGIGPKRIQQILDKYEVKYKEYLEK